MCICCGSEPSQGALPPSGQVLKGMLGSPPRAVALGTIHFGCCWERADRDLATSGLTLSQQQPTDRLQSRPEAGVAPGERNRLIKVLETAGIKLAGVASDVFGVSGGAMIRALIEGEDIPEAMGFEVQLSEKAV